MSQEPSKGVQFLIIIFWIMMALFYFSLSPKERERALPAINRPPAESEVQ